MVHSSCSRLAILTLYLALPLLVAVVIVSALLFAKWRGGVNEGRLWTCEQEPVQSMDKRPQKAAGWLCPAPQPYSLSPHGISHHSNTTWQRQGITNPLLPCFNSSHLSVTQWFVDSSFWINRYIRTEWNCNTTLLNTLQQDTNGCRHWRTGLEASPPPSHGRCSPRPIENSDLQLESHRLQLCSKEQMIAEASTPAHLTHPHVSALSSSPNSRDSLPEWTPPWPLGDIFLA